MTVRRTDNSDEAAVLAAYVQNQAVSVPGVDRLVQDRVLRQARDAILEGLRLLRIADGKKLTPRERQQLREGQIALTTAHANLEQSLRL